MERLGKQKKEMPSSTTALVLHHMKEVSDYTEKKYNRRYDGQQTEADIQWEAQYEERRKKYEAQREKQRVEDERLLASDPDAYYAKYPDRHPDVVAEEARREARNRARRQRYAETEARPRYRAYDWDKEEQGSKARSAGSKAADRINLEPFLTGKTPTDSKSLKKGGR
jgi:hypothetical protein